MAKKGVQDIRVDFIEAIGRTDNLRVLRSICDDIYRRKSVYNISKSEIESLLNEGYNRIKKLLGKDGEEFFAPLILMSEWGVMPYFDALLKGYNLISSREKDKLKLSERSADYSSKLYKAKEKGKLEKADEYESYLYAIKNPVECILKYEGNKESDDENESLGELGKLDILYKLGKVDSYDYEDYRKKFKRIVKEAKDSLKVLEAFKEEKVTEFKSSSYRDRLLEKYSTSKPIVFFTGMEDEIRYYIAYDFYRTMKNLSRTNNRFISTYDGTIKIDFEHMLVLYNYLKSVNYEKINEVEAVLCYTALEHIVLNILPHAMEQTEIFIKSNPTEFVSEKIPCYIHKYSTAYLLPNGYEGYIFEPTSLNQQSFISAIDKKDLNVEMMVGKYKKSQEFMKDMKNGILFDFLSKDLENRLLPYLVTSDFAVQNMNGVYGKLLLEELIERRNIFGDGESAEVMSNMYMRVVKPYNLEVLGSYVRTFCSKLSLLKDKDMIYIYYVSPQRIGIAVRNDVTEDMLKEVFEEKFINNLKKVKVPTLKDFLSGEYL